MNDNAEKVPGRDIYNTPEDPSDDGGWFPTMYIDYLIPPFILYCALHHPPFPCYIRAVQPDHHSKQGTDRHNPIFLEGESPREPVNLLRRTNPVPSHTSFAVGAKAPGSRGLSPFKPVQMILAYSTGLAVRLIFAANCRVTGPIRPETVWPSNTYEEGNATL